MCVGARHVGEIPPRKAVSRVCADAFTSALMEIPEMCLRELRKPISRGGKEERDVGNLCCDLRRNLHTHFIDVQRERVSTAFCFAFIKISIVFFCVCALRYREQSNGKGHHRFAGPVASGTKPVSMRCAWLLLGLRWRSGVDHMI